MFERVLDAFQHEGAPAGDTLPLACEPANLIPGVCLAVPDAVVDPFAFAALQLVAVLRDESGV